MLYKLMVLAIVSRIEVKKDLMCQKRQKDVFENPSRALDITASIATAATSENPRNIMKTPPELITF